MTEKGCPTRMPDGIEVKLAVREVHCVAIEAHTGMEIVESALTRPSPPQLLNDDTKYAISKMTLRSYLPPRPGYSVRPHATPQHGTIMAAPMISEACCISCPMSPLVRRPKKARRPRAATPLASSLPSTRPYSIQSSSSSDPTTMPSLTAVKL